MLRQQTYIQPASRTASHISIGDMLSAATSSRWPTLDLRVGKYLVHADVIDGDRH